MKRVSSPRKYAFENLKHTLTDLSFVHTGKKSGYPYCCIAFYFIRACYMNIENLITGTFWVLDENEKTQHVMCPGHQIFYKTTKKPLKYYTCKKCDWKQFEIKECKKCV